MIKAQLHLCSIIPFSILTYILISLSPEKGVPGENASALSPVCASPQPPGRAGAPGLGLLLPSLPFPFFTSAEPRIIGMAMI